MSELLSIFKCRRTHIVYIAEDGEHCVFRPRTPGANVGWYMTKDPVKKEELTRVARNHPFIYVDPQEAEIDEAEADPVIAYRNAIATEEKRRLIDKLGDPNQLRGMGIDPDALAKLMGLSRDMGDTAAAAQLQGIGTTESMAATSAESNTDAKPSIKVKQ